MADQLTRKFAALTDPLVDWTERYRRIWEQRVDRLDKYLERLKAKKEKRHGRQ